MQMRESGETYLETILMLENKLGFVRSVDVANELSYAKPSVSRAISLLKQNEYLSIQNNGGIQLTEKGRQKAEEIYERHRIIAVFLESTLGLQHDIADADACRIEHVISEEAFKLIKEKTGL